MTQGQANHADQTSGSDSPGFSDRLLTESIRCYESARSHPVDDRAVMQIVQADVNDHDVERRIVQRAKLLPIASRLDAAVQRFGRVLGLIILLAVFTAIVAGGSAARGALGDERSIPVNVFWLLGGVLGGQTILLLFWFALMIAGGRALATGSIGGALLGLAQWIARLRKRDAPQIAAIEAVGAVYGTGRLGRGTLGSISHGLWTVFNAACLVAVILLLSARQYNFCWESTILSHDSYTRITRVISGPIQLLGFSSPTVEEIAASRFDPAHPDAFPIQSSETREAWSGLLVGAIVLYGLAPRLLLLGLSLGARRRAAGEYRLDLGRPEYLRLANRLQSSFDAIKADTPAALNEWSSADSTVSPGREDAPPSRTKGSPAMLGFEMALPKTGWPIKLDGDAGGVIDLGIVDDRSARRRVLDALRDSTTVPAKMLVVCDLTSTPDRGFGSFLSDVGDAIGRPPTLILTAGEALRQRLEPQGVAIRIGDWRKLAAAARIPDEDVHEIDFDLLTDATRAKLRSLVTLPDIDQVPLSESRIEQAFQLIIHHLGPGAAAPDQDRLLSLHAEIGALYRSGSDSWAGYFDVGPLAMDNLASWKDQLGGAAARIRSLLPDSIAARPRWLVAGAVAGALGCITAAALISPVAIGSLPLWSLLGAAIGAVVPAGETREIPPGDSPVDLGDAVRSAALFAMLLELQGRDEMAITRILEQSIGAESDDVPMPDITAAAGWLKGLRDRFDAARAGGTAS